MEKTKILFFIPQLIGGGAERVTVNIMKLLDKDIFDVHLVVSTTEGSRYEGIENVVTLHDLKTPRTLFSILKLRKKINELKPDILFSSLLRGHIAINLSLFGVKKKPYLILRSPNSPKLLLEYNQISLTNKYLLENAYKTANLILAQTPEMKDEIAKYHVIDESKIKVFLNPIDTELIDAGVENITNPFHSENINVVAAGRIVYQKGFDILIQSFKKIIEKNSNFKLYIIGQDGIGEMKNLIKIIENLNLEEHVQFLGYQENPYKYFYFSDLYVLSSRWEGLPNTVLENLYLKKPVVATYCIPYMASLIQEGKNGLLVKVEDVNGLSEAILDYESLSMEFSSAKEIKKDLNDFFENIRISI